MLDMATTSEKTSVTVIGLGAMGSALAGAFLTAGHPTTVWNRTPGKGDDLAARGATVAATAEEAVRAGELVVVCVFDYDASESVLAPLTDALQGRVLVNVTSDLPERARTAAAWAAEHSIAYLDGAVMVPTHAIGAPDSLLFYAGSRESFERHESALKVLGGKSAYVGEDAGLAAVYDLSLLDYFYGAISGLVHGLSLAASEGVKASDVAPYMGTITQILPWVVDGSAANIDAGAYPGAQANLGVMAVSVDHILHTAKARGLDVAQLAGIKKMTDRAIALGHAADDWSSTHEALVNP
ncbi:NAD(P)-dependent oxidoreductase [Streptomyces inusitatus]|uniref:NAD(P)-dependent oxidoreductase n=1 Tax=Streptomyces inusitatus TaxID=68221 RepID=UPI004032E2F3